MIFKTTYIDKKVSLEMNHLLGKKYSFFQKVKRKGVGSSRFIVQNVSVGLLEFIHPKPYISYVNIEIRPKGIIVFFNKKYQTWAWCIPFYHLTIFKSKHSSIHAQGHSLTIGSLNNSPLHFLKKILEAKAKYEKEN